MAALAAVRCAQRADESTRFQQIVGNSPALDWSVQRIRPYCSWENVWIVAATNQPFRERVSDIPLLVWHFVEKYGERMSKRISRISDDSMDALKTSPWPGNIRELQNFIERAVVFTRGDVLELPPLPSLILTKREPVTLRESERHHLLKALEATKWVVGGPCGAAARLGMPRTTLMYKMQKHGLNYAKRYETEIEAKFR
jgi:DNA-binding NtrC family response regulator